FRDRQQQLAVALDLALLRRASGRQLGDLREPVDDDGDLGPELPFDVSEREPRVFDHVVEETTGDGRGIELEAGEDLRDLDRVRDVRLAGIAKLSPVRGLSEAVGAQ